MLNESNLVIFNLMIANLIMLVVYIPTNYVRMYNLGDHEFSRPFRVIQVVLVSANTMVIFVFNIKRYFDIYRIVNAHTQTIRLSTKVICIIYFGVIWVWSITLGITYCFLDIQESYNFLMFLYFLLYLIIFPIVLAVINSLTSRILLRSTEQCNNSSEMKNLTSSGVILSQTVTYFISHVAFFIYTLFDIEAEDTGMDYFSPTTLRIIMFCFHIIFFTYPCLNNLVLYKTSSTFRYFLNLYLFRCWYNPEEEQHIQCVVHATSVSSDSKQPISEAQARIWTEDLLARDEAANQLWNISVKHLGYSTDQITRKCFQQISRNRDLVGLFILHDTLDDSRVFLIRYTHEEIHSFRTWADLVDLWEMSEKHQTVLEDYEKYLTAAEEIVNVYDTPQDISRSKKISCPEGFSCSCAVTSNLETFEDELYRFRKSGQSLKEFIYLGTYVEPAIWLVILVIGMLLNGCMLMMFIREKSVKTETHLLIFLLVLNNVLTLTVYMPIQFLDKYLIKKTLHEPLQLIQNTVISLHALTLLALNAQRYFDIVRSVRPSVGGCRLSSACRCTLYVFFIWGLAFSISLAIYSIRKNVNRFFEVLLYHWLYTILLSIALAIFNSLSATQLQRVTERCQPNTDLKNVIESRVIFLLSLVFYLHHIPFFIFLGYESVEADQDYNIIFPPLHHTIVLISYTLYFTYPCATMIALYKTSSTAMKKLACYSDWVCGCIWILKDQDFIAEYHNVSDFNVILGCYIKPITECPITVVGFAVHIVVVLMFFLEKSLQRAADILILNILINDLIILIVQLIMITHYQFLSIIPQEEFIFNDFLIVVQILTFSVAMLTILALNMERFFHILRFINVDKCQFSPLVRDLQYLFAIWICAIIISISTLTQMNSKHSKHVFSIAICAAIFVFVVIIGLGILNITTGNKVKILLKEKQLIFDDIKLFPLSLSFCLTCFPIFIWLSNESYFGVHLRILGINYYSLIDYVLYHIYFCYPLFNTFAMYFTSNNYKRLFNKYLLRWRHQLDDNVLKKSASENEKKNINHLVSFIIYLFIFYIVCTVQQVPLLHLGLLPQNCNYMLENHLHGPCSPNNNKIIIMNFQRISYVLNIENNTEIGDLVFSEGSIGRAIVEENNIKNSSEVTDPNICSRRRGLTQTAQNYKALALCEKSKRKNVFRAWFWLQKWMKQCWQEFNKLCPSLTIYYLNNNYTELLNFKRGIEDSYNIDLDKLYTGIQYVSNSSKTYEEFSVARKYFIDKMSNNYSYFNQTLVSECLSPKNAAFVKNQYLKLHATISELRRTYVFRQYIEPVIIFLIFCVGLVWDGALLYIFYTNKDTRIWTGPNTIVCNIAVNDILGIILILPTQFALYNFENMANVFDFKIFFLLGSQTIHSFVNSFSILALSLQRYLTITRKNSLQISSKYFKPTRKNIKIYILCIWGTAFFITAFLALLLNRVDKDLTSPVKLYLAFAIVVFCVGIVIPISVTVLNVKTAQKLEQSAKNIPGVGNYEYLVKSRQKSSKIIIYLTAVYWVTQFPFFIWMLVMPSHGEKFPKYVQSLVSNLYFCNAFLNPVAIYIGSRYFREKFNELLFWFR
ncbi:hypothetical protein C0J52_22022 [Blattella germanica]|nr:hypothetical protein C0J52_22022 [Blattella germanica]